MVWLPMKVIARYAGITPDVCTGSFGIKKELDCILVEPPACIMAHI
jgi:hypothetical protein